MERRSADRFHAAASGADQPADRRDGEGRAAVPPAGSGARNPIDQLAFGATFRLPMVTVTACWTLALMPVFWLMATMPSELLNVLLLIWLPPYATGSGTETLT